MLSLNFVKTVKRNDFTKVFGGVGRRRTVKDLLYTRWKRTKIKKKSKLLAIRRAHSGWRNVKFGRLHQFKMFIFWNMKKRKPVSRFRR